MTFWNWHRAPEWNWRRISASAIWACVALSAIAVVSRRFSDDFMGYQSISGVCLLTFFLLNVNVAANVLFRSASPDVKSWKYAVTVTVTLLPPVSLGLALLPAQSALTTCLLLFMYCLAGIALLSLSNRPAATMSLAGVGFSNTLVGIVPVSNRDPDENPKDEPFTVSQRMTRKQNDREEWIVGSIQVDFRPQQKLVSVHLPFAPAFAAQPEMVAEVRHDAPARLKIATVQPYGARLEVRRSSQIDTPSTVEIAFRVVASTNAQATQKVA